MDYTKKYQSFFAYSVLTPPESSSPIRLSDIKKHLRLDTSDETQDSYLRLLMRTAASYCESYTRRTLLETTFRSFRNDFTATFEMRRSPFKSLTAFEYLVDGTFTAVDSTLYYTTQEPDYSRILLKDQATYPTDKDIQLQSIRIDFVAGYETTSSDLSNNQPELYLAILNHIAALYENRGDCDLASVASSLPNTSKLLYDSIKIIESV